MLCGGFLFAPIFSGSPYLQLSTAEHRTDGFFAAVWTRPE